VSLTRRLIVGTRVHNTYKVHEAVHRSTPSSPSPHLPKTHPKHFFMIHSLFTGMHHNAILINMAYWRIFEQLMWIRYNIQITKHYVFVVYFQFCTNHEVSDKNLYPTFARTKPHDSQISMAIVSLLLKFDWKKVVFVYNELKPMLASTIQEVCTRCSNLQCMLLLSNMLSPTITPPLINMKHNCMCMYGVVISST
jgi:hypothetical protein